MKKIFLILAALFALSSCAACAKNNVRKIRLSNKRLAEKQE